MQNTTKNPLLIIFGILTLIMSLYLCGVTLSVQLLSQNQGFTYPALIGLVLFLVFLLCNLFTKLIAGSPSYQNNVAWKIISWLFLILIGAYYLYSKLRYSFEISADESNIYKGAVSIVEGLYSENDYLITSALINPCEYLYSLLLSIIFRFTEASSRIFIITNSILHVINCLFIFLITKRVSDRLCALFTVVLAMVIPAHTFSVYTYTSNSLFDLIILFDLYILVLFLVPSKFSANNDVSDSSKKGRVGKIFLGMVLCISNGLLIFAEPTTLVIMILVIIIGFSLKNQNAFSVFICIAISMVLFAGFTFLKSNHMEKDFGEVLVNSAYDFDFSKDNNSGQTREFSEIYENFSNILAVHDDDINNNYYFINDVSGNSVYSDMAASWLRIANQFLYMFLIMMCISSVMIVFKEKYSNILYIWLFYIGFVIIMFFANNREVHKNTFISILVIICGVSLNYLYLNHHPEQKIVDRPLDALNKTGRNNNISRHESDASVYMTEEDFERRAKALIFIGNDEELYNSIKQEEHKKAQAEERKRGPLDDALDDYDDDFFLDSEDEDDSASASKQTLTPTADQANKSSLEPKPAPIKLSDTKPLPDLSGVEFDSKPYKKKVVKKEEPKPEIPEEPKVEKIERKVEHIPNPLPVPKPKKRNPIDFKIQDTGSDWDYDISDDDDWDV